MNGFIIYLFIYLLSETFNLQSLGVYTWILYSASWGVIWHEISWSVTMLLKSTFECYTSHAVLQYHGSVSGGVDFSSIQSIWYNSLQLPHCFTMLGILAIAPLGSDLLPLGYAENSVLHVNQFKSLCLCENSPRFHQIVSDKRSKIKTFQGSMPPDRPSLPHVLHTDTYLPPPPPPLPSLPIIRTIFCPWGKKPCI